MLANRLRSALKIEPGEGYLVGINLLMSVFVGLPRLFTLTAGSAFFLKHFTARDMPYVYLAVSVLLPAVGFLHLHLQKRMSFVRLQAGSLAFLCLVSAIFLVVLRLTDAAWAAAALFIWYAAEASLSTMVLWSTANRVFTVRQGKRLFGLIGAGEIISAIVGGALTPLLTRLLGTVNLLIMSVGGMFLALVTLMILARHCADRLEKGSLPGSHDKNKKQTSFAALFRSKYLALIFLNYAIPLSVGFIIYNIFFFEIKKTLLSPDEIAGFLGQFIAAVSLLGLLLRFVFSGRLLLRFGVFGGLLSAPIAVFMLGVVVVGIGWSNVGLAYVFWAVVCLRLCERLFVSSFGIPAYYTLYQPLSNERRVRVQTTAESILSPIGGGLTGLLLLFLTVVFGLTSVGLTAALLPLLLAWILVGVGASREFKVALTSALKRRGISGCDLSVSDPTSLRILENGLQSHRPAEVLYCLKLLEEVEHPRLQELLIGLVSHQSAPVREGVYQAIEDLRDESLYPRLSSRIEDEHEPGARGALVRAIAATDGSAARELVEANLLHPDEITRCATIVAMVLYCGPEAKQQGIETLKNLESSTDEKERVLAARILGDLTPDGNDEFFPSLLADRSIAVRCAALRSVSSAANSKTWLHVIENLEQSSTRPDAVRCLLKAGEQSIEPLTEVYSRDGSSYGLKKLILQILGRVGSASVVEFLRGELQVDNRGLLSEVLWSLHLCGYRASSETAHIEACLNHEIVHGDYVIAVKRDFGNQPGMVLLESALAQEYDRTLARIFLLFSFLYDSDTFLKISSNFGESPALRDLAIELFEENVAEEHKVAALPILLAQTENDIMNPRDRIRQILFEPRLRHNSWIQACVVDAAGSAQNILAEGEWMLLGHHDENIVREAALFYSAGASSGGSAYEGPLPVTERVKVLKGVSIFREIDDEVLAELAQRLEEVVVEAGETVFAEGEPGRSMFIISKGELRLHLGDDVVSELRQGEIFGELSALDTTVREVSATAISRAHLFRLSDVDLHAFMARRIEVVRGIIAVLCQRVRTAPTEKLAAREEREHQQAESFQGEVFAADVLSSLEKVLILKTADIFAAVEDEILTEVAKRSEEIRLRKNEVLFQKGDPGTITYIIVAGRLRIHIGDQWIAEATEGAVVGELAALSSEPRTASITAVDDTLLLGLDQASLFELMWDQHEIVRGIILVLVSRLRRLRGAAQVDG